MRYQFIATAAFGLEGIVKRELLSLGFTDAKAEPGGVQFTASAEEAFNACLWLRTADRVQLIVCEDKAETFEDLFQLARNAPFSDLLAPDASFPVSAHCARSRLMSPSDCQSIVKKAIAEQMMSGSRTSWCPETGARYAVSVSLHADRARIAVDACGDALNRRGYRTWNGEAPIRETLAAALVMMSNRRAGEALHDPCCGTGTLLVEAAFLQSDRAPGLTRAFDIEKWRIADKKNMQIFREQAKSRYAPDRISDISGSDISPETLSLCERHIAQANLRGKINVFKKDLRDLSIGKEPICFIANPPYGERMADRRGCESLYRALSAMQIRHPGSRLNVITSNAGFERVIGRRAQQKRRLYNGRLECEFLQYR